MRVMNSGKTLFESFQENLKEASVDESWCQEQAEYYFNQDCQDSGDLDEVDYVDILNDYTDNEAESKRVESLIADAWKIIKDHIYHSDWKKYIELSDNHTLWQIENDKFPSDDYAAEEYNTQVESALEDFKAETGVELLLLGRSGRHACVELNYQNALKYSELAGKQNELEQRVINAMNSWEPENESVVTVEGDKPEEKIEEQDSLVRVVTSQQEDRNYSITDITELNKVSDGDVQAPIDISGLLVEVDGRLTESYGEKWGQINFQSTRFNTDTKDSNALFELCVGDKTYLMSMLLEENGSVLKVNNTKGQTIFKRKSNDVTSLAESYIKQFLPKEADEVPEAIKHINEDLHDAYNFLKTQIEVSKDVPKEEKEAFVKYLQGQLYAFAAEVSESIRAEEPTEDDKLELPSFDKMVEDIFGKEWVKEVKEPETKEVEGTETLKESAQFYYKEFSGAGEIDYVEFETEQEACDYAEKVNKDTGHETAVYRIDNDECISLYDAINEADEPETKEEPVADEPGEEKVEEPKNGLGTGYAAFTRKPKNLEMVEDKSNYFTEGEASYLICEKQKLSKDEFDKLKEDFSATNKYCKDFEPLDLDNYSYNCIEFSCDDYDYTLLVDPSGYDYCRYVAKIGGNE